MQIKPVNAQFAVSGQIQPADVAQIKAGGFQAIVCNRPNGESWGQPAFDAVADVAREAGVAVVYLPIIAGGMSEADIADFERTLAEMPAPVLAYCRSGTRCITLWACAQVRGGAALDDVLQQARQAGYDLSPMAGIISG